MKPYEKELLDKRLKDFMTEIIPVELLPHLPCLTSFDKEEIQAVQLNHGPVRASMVLIDRLKRRQDGFQQFIQALSKCGGQHVALMLDPYCTFTSEGREFATSDYTALLNKLKQSLVLNKQRSIRKIKSGHC